MQKESSTVARSIVSRKKAAKHVLSRYGWKREFPKSVLINLNSMNNGNAKFKIAKVIVGMIQGR